MARLGEIFDLQMGKTPARANSNYWVDGTNNWVSIADLSSYKKYVGDTKEQITEKAVQESGIKQVPPNTVIMSFKLSIGKTAITREAVYTNEAIMAFIPKPGYAILPDYIFYLFSEMDWSKGSNRAVMGTTLNKATLENIQIVLSPIDTQRKVVAVLDKLSDLISLRKQQLAKLDELIKARFVEMFEGIPETEYITLKDICSIITDGTHQPPKFVESGIPFLFVSNIVGNVITYQAEKFITEGTYAELIKRTPIEVGDILLSTVGSYGHPAIVKSSKKFCFQRHIAYLKPNGELVDSAYLHGALLSENVQRQIEERVKGIAQKTLNLSEIKEIRIPLPSLEMQKRFTVFSNNIDDVKLTIQQSLDKLEVLKKSLMQEYFG